MKRIMVFLCIAILTFTIIGSALARSYVQCAKCGADATASYGPWKHRTYADLAMAAEWDERTVTIRCKKGHSTTFTEEKNRKEVYFEAGCW